MAERFTRRVRSGEIRSLDELKAQFKALARETHPDTAGAADAAERTAAFVALRRDYERALAELGGTIPGAAAAGPAESAGSGTTGGAGDWIGALEALIKRGFPKEGRHDKERQRYRVALARARSSLSALGPGAPAAFDAFAAELAAQKEAGAEAAETALRLFRDIVAARRAASRGAPADAAAAAAAFELRRVSAGPILAAPDAAADGDSGAERIGEAATAFLGLILGVEGAGRTERGSR